MSEMCMRLHVVCAFALHPQELNEQKNELIARVTTLKKELQDWRSKLDTQVKTYRTVSLNTRGCWGSSMMQA